MIRTMLLQRGMVFILSMLVVCGYAQQGISVTAEDAYIPVVPGRTDNAVLRIKVYADKETSLKQIALALKGLSAENVQQVNIYATGTKPSFSRDIMLFASASNPKASVTLKGDLALQKGESYFWVAAVVKPGTSLKSKISFDCKNLLFSSGKIKPATISDGGSRMGLALRNHMDDGVHTYRIPGLATTKKGTLLAVYDIRYNNSRDLQEDINVGLSRSTDGGATWEPMKNIMDMKTWGGKPRKENGIGDPTILVDENSGTIWVAGLWAHGHPGKATWVGSEPGLTPEKTGQFMLVKSTDDGVTWSEPINITDQIKKEEWYLMLQGPGKGITMKNGTLVFPAQFKDKDQVPHATIVYSKDGGKSWKIGTGARSHTTEAQVVELLDGSLMLNMRDDRGRDKVSGSRAVSITKDLGATWQEHATNRNTLDEPVCMASIDRFYFKKKDGTTVPLLVFSNPDSKTTRNNITIKISKDDGMNWPKEYNVLLDKGTAAGYTCLTQIDDYTVGIVYESSKADLMFQAIDLRDVLKD